MSSPDKPFACLWCRKSLSRDEAFVYERSRKIVCANCRFDPVLTKWNQKLKKGQVDHYEGDR